MATYIFDFDGTLADSFSLVCNILINHAQQLRCKQLTSAELLALKNMHAREVLKCLAIPYWRVALFVRALRKITYAQSDTLSIFPEWPIILKQLSLNHQIGLVSSNSYKVIESVLKKQQIFQFFDFISGDNSLFGKAHCLKKLIQQKKLNPALTYYIGDEVRDIEAAYAANLNSIAVSWGFNTPEKLLQAKPNHLVNNFAQLECLFNCHKTGLL